MKKSLIALSIRWTISLTFANYMAIFPLEQTKGGALPKGSVKFTNQSQIENWLATEPFYTDWINVGDLTSCNWTPNPNTVPLGKINILLYYIFFVIIDDTIQQRKI